MIKFTAIHKHDTIFFRKNILNAKKLTNSHHPNNIYQLLIAYFNHHFIIHKLISVSMFQKYF